MTSDVQIFDRALKRTQRARAAKHFTRVNYLYREAAQRIAEQFGQTITRTFPNTLLINDSCGALADLLPQATGVETLYAMDTVPGMFPKHTPQPILADEEWLPFAPGSLNAILSPFSLHWVNDLPGCLIQIRHALAEGGLFLGSMLGGQTLKELKEVFLEVEPRLMGGIAARTSPIVEVKDAGALLQRAGFQLPVSNSDTITVRYKNAWQLMDDLRTMGESNALIKRPRHFTSPDLLHTIVEEYHARFADEEGCIPATFELITLTGWKS